MGFLKNVFSKGSSTSVAGVLKEFRQVGGQCRKDHQMLVEMMAQTVEGHPGSKMIRDDVANDIVFMTTDVQKYNPVLAESLREVARKLNSIG